jgi:hypothetical protein
VDRAEHQLARRVGRGGPARCVVGDHPEARGSRTCARHGRTRRSGKASGHAADPRRREEAFRRLVVRSHHDRRHAHLIRWLWRRNLRATLFHPHVPPQLRGGRTRVRRPQRSLRRRGHDPGWRARRLGRQTQGEVVRPASGHRRAARNALLHLCVHARDVGRRGMAAAAARALPLLLYRPDAGSDAQPRRASHAGHRDGPLFPGADPDRAGNRTVFHRHSNRPIQRLFVCEDRLWRFHQHMPRRCRSRRIEPRAWQSLRGIACASPTCAESTQ